MRRPALLAALLLSVSAVAVSTPSRAVTGPTFSTVKLPGTGGSAEPRVAVGPKDVKWAVTSASNGDEVVFRSPDGIAWTKVTTPPGQTSATIDVDVATFPSGRVITSELDTAGINFINTYSDDQGKTWKQSTGSTFADTDRQWFATGPDNTAYLLFHNLLSGTLQHNMFVQTSTDGGATWLPPVPVTSPPMQSYLDLQCADSGGPSGISVNQKTGQVYVFFGTRSSPVGGCAAQPVEVNIVAANRAWVVTAAAGQTTSPLGWHESLAVDDTASGKVVGMQLQGGGLDDAGNVYVAYPESPNPYPDYDGAAIKVIHADAALSGWSTPLTVEPTGGRGHVLPLVVGGDTGRVGLTYYTGLADGTWRSDAAIITGALGTSPRIERARLSPIEVEKGTASELMGACNTGPTATLNGFTCSRSTDVNGLAVDSCGRLLATWPSATGSAQGTYTAQQTGGTRLRTTACAKSVARPVVVPPEEPTTTPPTTSSGGGLAATGGAVGVGLIALLLLGGGVMAHRRKTVLPD